MKTVQWGIIGCGNVTEKKSGPAFNKIAHSKLVAVMRRDREKAKEYASRHQVPRWYDSAHDLIHDDQVNAIYIATPPSSHEEYAIAAIEAGKPVYLEKPMSTDAISAERISKAAQQAGVKLSIAHYRRRLPLFSKIKILLQQNIIGTVSRVTLDYQQPFDATGFAPGPGNWRLIPEISGGGIFHDLAPHQLDLLYYFFGYPSHQHGISLNKGKHYEAADMIAAQALFPNNILFTGNWNFNSSFEKDECVIIGDKGSLVFSIFRMDKLNIHTPVSEEELNFGISNHVQQPMIEEVVRYFLDKGENPCTGLDGVRVMQLIDKFTST